METPLPVAIIVDLDGTLADVLPARHHVQKRPGHRRDFTAFHTYATTDAEPIEGTVRKLRERYGLGWKVLLVSGRHQKWRAATVAWLAKHRIPWDELFMRADHDGRQDTEVKAEMYREQIAPRWRVIEAFDDRPSVVEMWRSIGLQVHVVPGWTEADGR